MYRRLILLLFGIGLFSFVILGPVREMYNSGSLVAAYAIDDQDAEISDAVLENQKVILANQKDIIARLKIIEREIRRR